jgi:hypothetical protein
MAGNFQLLILPSEFEFYLVWVERSRSRSVIRDQVSGIRRLNGYSIFAIGIIGKVNLEKVIAQPNK